MLLHAAVVAPVEPLLERRHERSIERIRTRLCARLHDQVDVDLEVTGADRHLDAVAVSPRLGERACDRRFACPEQPQDAPSGRFRPREE